jgi:hypothetical protein
MSLSVAVIDALVAAGATVEQLAAAVKADMAEAEERLAQKRANDAERQRRSRASRGVTVTPRDDALVTAGAPLDKKAPQTPKELIPPTPTNDADASSVPPAGVDPPVLLAWMEIRPTARPIRKNRKRSIGSRLKARLGAACDRRPAARAAGRWSRDGRPVPTSSSAKFRDTG